MKGYVRGREIPVISHSHTERKDIEQYNHNLHKSYVSYITFLCLFYNTPSVYNSCVMTVHYKEQAKLYTQVMENNFCNIFIV